MRAARTLTVIAAAGGLAVIAGCAPNNGGDNVHTVTVFETPKAAAPSSSKPASSARTGDCVKDPVVAIDPGHNPVEVNTYDAETGVLMRDYSNGAEDQDVMAVSNNVKEQLEAEGYTVVLVKKSADENVDYRERVRRAEEANADVAISVHTYTDDHRVFPQRVGNYREGPGEDGQLKRVTFEDADLAARSQELSEKYAEGRSRVEGRQVDVVDNSFDGRAPLWGGNIPMISLISTKVPWVYHEFGTATGGGNVPIGPNGIATYTESLVAGTKAALPRCR